MRRNGDNMSMWKYIFTIICIYITLPQFFYSYQQDLLDVKINDLSEPQRLQYYYDKISELREKDIIKSFDYYDRGIKYAYEKENYKWVSKLHEQVALNYTYLQQFEKALEYHQIAMSYAEFVSDITLKWKIENNRGVIFYLLKDYKRSLRYFKKAENWISGEPDVFKHGILFNNIGELYRLVGINDSSFIYHYKALDIFQNSDQNYNLMNTHIQLAETFLKEGKYDEAKNTLLKNIGSLSEGSSNDIKGRYYKLLGIVEVEADHLVLAGEYLKNAINSAKSAQDRLLVAEIYEEFSTAYREKGLYKDAFSYLEKAKMLHDSISYFLNNEKANLWKIRTDIERQIARANATELEYQKNKSYILQIILGALIIIAVLIAIAYNIKRKGTAALTGKNKELEVINNKFISFIEQSSDAFRIIKPNGEIILWSKANENLTGIKKETALGKNYFDITQKLLPDSKKNQDSISKIESKVSQMVSSADFHPMTIRKELKTINGESKFVLDTIFPIKTGNEVLIGTISRDDTVRYLHEQELTIAKEKAEVSDRMKSEFLAQMSHEIRTPINTILSFTNLLESELKDRLERELAESFISIHHAGSRIIRTIDMLLNMSELQTGTYEHNFKRMDLNKDIIKPLMEEFQIFAGRKNLKLIDNISNDFPLLYIDEYSVNQIFHNLINNAIKFTEQGSIEISNGVNNNGNAFVKVSDTGIGISKAYLENIFAPFSQEEQGYTRSYEGNGLGLALVKKYCELNNAEIKVDSEKGEGTTFSVIFSLIE